MSEQAALEVLDADALAADAAAACSIATAADFMSTAPRPCRTPSSIAPLHGPCRHGTLPGSTTSMWPLRQIRPGPVPGSVAASPQSSSRGASSPG